MQWCSGLWGPYHLVGCSSNQCSQEGDWLVCLLRCWMDNDLTSFTISAGAMTRIHQCLVLFFSLREKTPTFPSSASFIHLHHVAAINRPGFRKQSSPSNHGTIARTPRDRPRRTIRQTLDAVKTPSAALAMHTSYRRYSPSRLQHPECDHRHRYCHYGIKVQITSHRGSKLRDYWWHDHSSLFLLSTLGRAKDQLLLQ